ncbi:beta-1,4-glucuronosyltransferase WelK [Phenylobacterium sp.]|uniref:beta-1,4-glucuronosyltransferase WelK n=1 Tax=Phenylobacterium sp. TaxID=1871053 RepID=UPI002CE0356C|nr:glycosyltransferase [Phenylobacterium sp.]HLZ75553.1 glycosyltransferase [Phenylobacterium sp.]
MSAAAEPHANDRALAPKRLRICMAASGGGHLRQLLDLRSLWSAHDYFFVTEDTALGQSLREEHPTYFVPHFALGQAKLGAPLKMAWRAFISFFKSAALILRKRPQLVITTGAGAVFFTVLWARILGAHVVVVESFARFDHPSVFGRMTKPLAQDFVVQSAALAAHYPEAQFFDPFRILDTKVGAKQPLMFATVGAVLPFDRLVNIVAEAHAGGAISDRILVQTGVGGVRPPGLEVVETLPFEEVKALLRDASIVVCHGGTGSLITALREGCHVIAVPRLFRLGEVYDDHQLEISEAFEKRGLVQVANTAEELAAAVRATRDRARVVATTEPTGLTQFLESVVERIASSHAGTERPRPATAD